MARMDFKMRLNYSYRKDLLLYSIFESQAYKKVMLMLLTLKLVCLLLLKLTCQKMLMFYKNEIIIMEIDFLWNFGCSRI